MAERLAHRILSSVLKREKPKFVKEYEEWILLYKEDDDKSIVKLAEALEKAWELKLEKEDTGPECWWAPPGVLPPSSWPSQSIDNH